MQEWFDALTTFEKIFWYIAVPFSLIFLIQLVLSIAGLDGRKNKTTDEQEEQNDNIPKSNRLLTLGRSFFSLRNTITFLMVFGWMGVISYDHTSNRNLSFLIALAAGIFAMVLVTFLFYFSNKPKHS